MPAVSRAQQRYLYAKFGAAWVKRHHFDTKGPLPMHVPTKGPLDRLLQQPPLAVATKHKRHLTRRRARQ